MDRGLKERLVGAVVLVVLGVWLVPRVLDGPGQSGRTESEALQLPAPTQSVPLRTQTIILDNDREPPTPAVGAHVSGLAAASRSQQPVRDISATPRTDRPATAFSARADVALCCDAWDRSCIPAWRCRRWQFSIGWTCVT